MTTTGSWSRCARVGREGSAPLYYYYTTMTTTGSWSRFGRTDYTILQYYYNTILLAYYY